MLPEQIFRLYTKRKISSKDVVKYTNLKDLITSAISVEEKMEILTSGKGERIYNHSESDIIWEYFEKDYFNSEQMATLEKLRYFHLNAVIRNYQEDQKRKIATELGVLSSVSEEKLIEIFSPQIVLRELRKGVSDELKDFYNVDLKNIYNRQISTHEDSPKSIVADKRSKSEEDRADKLELLVISEMLDENIEENKNKEKFYQECLDLYDKKFLSIDSLVHIKLPENIATEYIFEHNNKESLVIDFFNAKLISQDYIMELYPDNFEEAALKLIDNGMNVRVLSGMYSTGELIEHIDVLGLDGLRELKDDINIGIDGEENHNSKDEEIKKETTILSLYLENRLSYEALKSFVDAEIISEEDFSAIEDKYNVNDAVKKLRQEGLFSIKVYGEPEKRSTHAIGPKGYDKSKEAEPYYTKMEKGIDRDLIKMFYEALGMTSEDFVAVDATKCPIFEGYTLITDVKRRLCYLEGDKGTRTYIVPLKYVIEQVGNSKSRKEFAKKIEHIGASANHTANWGRNMINKIAEVSFKMTIEDKNNFRKEHGDIIQAIADSYIGKHPIR